MNKNLARILFERGIDQKELADAVGVTEASMSFYVSGKRNPKLEVAKKIADYLGVSLDYLVE